MKKQHMIIYLVVSLVFGLSSWGVLAEGATAGAPAKKYDVIFKAEGGLFDKKAGTKELTKQVEEKKAVTQPNVPTKEGFQFTGWYTDQKLTKSWDFKTAVTANTTLFAKWEAAAKEYQISFNSNGGTNLSPLTVKEKQRVAQPKAPTKAGFTFGGWYSDASLTKAWDFSTIVTVNTTLYAKWDAVINQYQVTFSTDGGTTINTQTVIENQTVALPEMPAKPGFTFDGWYRDAALSQIWNFSTPVTTALTLYAKWEPVVSEYQVTFNTNGGSLIPAQQVKENQPVLQPQAPTKANVTFGGWYSDEKLTKLWDFKTIVTSDTTLYAKWNTPVIKEYQVSFNTNGGSAVASQQVKENQAALQPQAPTKANVTFGGWYSDEKLSKAWDFKTVITKDTTLYAKWNTPVIKEYQVSFNTNGGSVIAPQQVKENQVALQPQAPTKKEFTFVGWYSDEKLTKAWDFKTTITANTTLYAKWQAIVKPVVKEFNIDFNTNGGSRVSAQKIKEGQVIVQPEAPTKADFKFAGWYSDSKLTKAWDFKTSVSGNVTLYAKWEAVPTKKTPVPTKKKSVSTKKTPLPAKKVLSKKNNLPQTGEMQQSIWSLLLGSLLLMVTFVIVVKKAKANANK